ncbi:MAG: polyprenyl synthetase family protein [Betaproteobacteria bacterium]|nr:polyprenyl synthetase family protein [Betaproteobacteria bacterium]NBT10313.1 polyprenyl synthetase family protein [Betaproteobacteria bacterium]NBU49204.1 polyprenyl synthetase family protein [Betaproteobacteria bacterium]NBX97167.1 polyprenyl synthetase family protein [Betaproteobacteria bacterium]
MTEQLRLVEQALSAWVPADAPAGLGEAMRYGVLDGGKRLRPLLVLAAAQAVQGHEGAALRAACAVELIHAYSLVHDDMPCMDNDVLRRGKPTVHVQFGQAQAMLAGDAMQALAFELLTPLDAAELEPSLQARLVGLLSRGAGYSGMAGGQAIDLASVGRQLQEADLRRMHELKTGALLQASVDMGAACGVADAATLAALSRYGHAIGLAFQVVDDILDVTQDTEVLGKTAGKDREQSKPTYVSLMGLQGAQRHARELHERALQALVASALPDTHRLRELADLVVHRQH